MAKFISQFMTEGKFDYKKFNAHREQLIEQSAELDRLTEEPDNETFTKEVKTAEAKSQGKGKKAEVAKPSVQAVKMETGSLPEKVQETIEMYDADAINGVTVETLEEGKKWIAGAIKKPGALHKALHVPAEKKIPAGKLEKAAEAPGKMGKRARLAMTLKKLRKEQVERIEEAKLTAKQKKIAAIAGDPEKIDREDFAALRAGHSMKKEEVELDEMVTRKHFQQVADVIKAHPDAAKRAELAKYHAEIFKKQNPRFDHKRFYAAANVPMKEEVEQIEETKKFDIYHKNEYHRSTTQSKTAKEAKEKYLKAYPKHHPMDVKVERDTHFKEEVEQIEERELSPEEMKKREEVVKTMKKKLPAFKERYGKRAKEVMYATATKIAKKD